jgi:hypothetical protein
MGRIILVYFLAAARVDTPRSSKQQPSVWLHQSRFFKLWHPYKMLSIDDLPRSISQMMTQGRRVHWPHLALSQTLTFVNDERHPFCHNVHESSN